MFKERKSFVVAALAVLVCTWLLVTNSFLGNVIRGSVESSAILNLINFILLTGILGFTMFFFVKNEFEPNDAVVALVAIAAVVSFVLGFTGTLISYTKSIRLNLDANDNMRESIKVLGEGLEDVKIELEEGIAFNTKNIVAYIVGIIFNFVNGLVPCALVLFSNEPKKTLDKVVGFFKGLFAKKPAEKAATK